MIATRFEDPFPGPGVYTNFYAIHTTVNGHAVGFGSTPAEAGLQLERAEARLARHELNRRRYVRRQQRIRRRLATIALID